MAKVVMLTAMAGAGLDLSYGDVYETDDVEAARFLEHQAAREFDEKEDGHKPVKRRQEAESLAEGHFQNDKPKGKRRKPGIVADTNLSDSTANTDATTGDSSGEGTTDATGDVGDRSTDAEAPEPEPEPEPAPAPTPRPRVRR